MLENGLADLTKAINVLSNRIKMLIDSGWRNKNDAIDEGFHTLTEEKKTEKPKEKVSYEELNKLALTLAEQDKLVQAKEALLNKQSSASVCAREPSWAAGVVFLGKSASAIAATEAVHSSQRNAEEGANFAWLDTC